MVIIVFGIGGALTVKFSMATNQNYFQTMNDIALRIFPIIPGFAIMYFDSDVDFCFCNVFLCSSANENTFCTTSNAIISISQFGIFFWNVKIIQIIQTAHHGLEKFKQIYTCNCCRIFVVGWVWSSTAKTRIIFEFGTNLSNSFH